MADIEGTSCRWPKVVLKKLTVNLTRLPPLETVRLDAESSEVKADSSKSDASGSRSSSPAVTFLPTPPVVELDTKEETPRDPKPIVVPLQKKLPQIATIRREVAKKPFVSGANFRSLEGTRKGTSALGGYSPRTMESARPKRDVFVPLPVKSSFRIPKKRWPCESSKVERGSGRRDVLASSSKCRSRSSKGRNDDRRFFSTSRAKCHTSKPYERKPPSARPCHVQEEDDSLMSKLPGDYVQYVVGAVMDVEKWLNNNPVGEKPNSAGEVQPVKRTKKVEPVTNFLKSLVKNSDNDPVPMSIDADELVTGIQQFRGQMGCELDTICGQLTRLRSEMREEAMSVDEVDMPAVSCHKQIHVVLDTNVLVSDLYAVDEIMKSRTGENDSFQVVLVVPWIVLQELDCLKTDRRDRSPKLREMASKAVRYIHDLFTNCHPQVKGQAFDETVEDVGMTIESNDDRILQCCLSYQKRGVGQVVLLSDDRNLCSKAIVSGVKARTKEAIKAELDRIAPIVQETGRPRMQRENAFYEQMLREFKTALLGVLEVILKQEMEAAYEDLWLNIVLIKPPWTNVQDLLKCFTKHWIAVFGLVIKRSAKIHLDMMVQKFRLIKESDNFDHLKSMMKETLRFLAYFEPRQAYLSKLRLSILTIRGLLHQLKGVQGTEWKRPQKFAVEEVEQAAANEGASTVEEGLTDPLVIVKRKFQNVWSSVNYICGSLYDSFGIGNPISYTRLDALPSPAESFHFIPRFYPVITDIRDLVRRILRSPVNIEAHEESFQKLCFQLEHYFVLLNLASEHRVADDLTPEMLHLFCTNCETRELLGRGLVHLEECCAYVFRLILRIKDFSL